MLTLGLRRIRFSLYEAASVVTRSRPFSVTNQTGVATGVPSRL
jgi:hypothetical protein